MKFKVVHANYIYYFISSPYLYGTSNNSHWGFTFVPDPVTYIFSGNHDIDSNTIPILEMRPLRLGKKRPNVIQLRNAEGGIQTQIQQCSTTSFMCSLGILSSMSITYTIRTSKLSTPKKKRDSYSKKAIRRPPVSRFHLLRSAYVVCKMSWNLSSNESRGRHKSQ